MNWNCAVMFNPRCRHLGGWRGGWEGVLAFAWEVHAVHFIVGFTNRHWVMKKLLVLHHTWVWEKVCQAHGWEKIHEKQGTSCMMGDLRWVAGCLGGKDCLEICSPAVWELLDQLSWVSDIKSHVMGLALHSSVKESATALSRPCVFWTF